MSKPGYASHWSDEYAEAEVQTPERHTAEPTTGYTSHWSDEYWETPSR